MPTVREIAKAAGVSPATVSRVLNGSPSVSEALARQVRRAAAQMERGGQRTTNGPSLAVCVTFPARHGETYYTLTLIRSITEAAGRRGYEVVVRFSDDFAERENTAVQSLPEHCAGALLIGNFVAVEKQYIGALSRQGIPFFLFSRGPRHGRFSYVTVDDYGGAYRATKHLLDLGHRRIAHISGPEGSRDASDRIQGFVAACRDAQVPQQDQCVISGDFMEPSGAEAAKRILGLSQRPSAVFAANDAMAIAAMRVFRQHGLRIPKDIAVVGFDDIDLAPKCDPPLTTIHVPLNEMARLATDQLIQQIDPGGKPYSKITLGGELRIRGSCGARVESASYGGCTTVG